MIVYLVVVMQMEKSIYSLEPYSNLTDLEIFKYLLNKDDSDDWNYTKLSSVSKNIDELYIISRAAEVYEKKCYINNIYYEDLIEEYNMILKKTSKLAQELNLKNSLELSILFMFLLWDGYFSKNKKNKYNFIYILLII